MTTKLTLLVLLFFFCEQTFGSNTTLSFAGICKLMVESQGYVCEEHTVTTKDGYLLSLQRIPTRLLNTATGNRPPVLLQHGVLMDGVTWLINPPDQALAFVLADNGFDVWIANSRGTQYSLGHTTLSSNNPEYWDWSWDELAAYDLPAVVQYVYDLTGQKLHYVGHSQGTLIALAAFSQGQLLGRVKSAGLLSPVAYLSRMTSSLAIDAVQNFIGEFLYWSGLHQFEPRSEAVVNFLNGICKKRGINCNDLLTSFTGENCCLSLATVHIFLEHEPQSTATKNMIHLAQMARDGTMAMYDYEDPNMNIKHYGQPDPPAYNLTNIPSDLPLFVANGGRDALSDVDDVKFLMDNLKDHDSDKLNLQFIEDYAHADYVMAINANKLVYEPLIAFFRQHDE